MKGEYRFLRTRNGVTAFAKVEVVTRHNTVDEILWSDSVTDLRNLYEASVQMGTDLATEAHLRWGGTPEGIEVISLTETAADTKPDAVKVATALAVWKALGHSESEAEVSFDGGQWNVSFRHRQN